MTALPEAIARVEAMLLAPGAPFELEEGEVLGERVKLFKNRAPHLRAVLERSASFGDAEYLVFSDGKTKRRFTYREHLAKVASTAKVLRERYGVGKGDRVAILGANSPEWIVTFWATVSLDAIAVGLNGWWTGDEIAYGLRDSEPKVLVADFKRLARLEGADPGVPVIVMESDFDAIWNAHPEASLPTEPIAPEDPCLILYTSGTTGRPKGVVHMHVNICSGITTSFFHGARMLALHPPQPIEPGQAPLPTCTLVTSPLFHVSGLHAAAISTLAGGAKSVWTVGRFDPEVALSLIQEEKVTGWGYTSTILHRLLHHPRIGDFDLRSMRLVGGGGSPIPKRLQTLARSSIPSILSYLSVGYGLTEGTAFTTMNPGEELVTFPDSAGRPLPSVEVEIRDPSGRALPEGEEGEIHVRGPLVMKEYWRNPEATAESIRPGRWLNTGDVGSFEGGRLYLATRKRDLILRGGENVYPVEIEHRLEDHPGVAEAAVVGVESDEFGQEVKAFVVTKPGASPTKEELSAWVAETLAYYKVPTHWDLRTEALPRNATGKVLKHVLVAETASTFIEE